MTLRVAFMGTPDFAVPTLRGLAAAGHVIACVYTQPPRPAGRGHKEKLSPVHAAAKLLGLDVRTPESLADPAVQQEFSNLDLDAAVVAAYGKILPPAFLSAPRLGCINLHGSLLPRWRGAAPIARAILAGDDRFGITIMQMDEGMDTGPILLQQEIPAGARPTAGELHDAFAARGAELTIAALDGLADGSVRPTPQPERGVTMAPKLEKEIGRIDWRRPAIELDRLVRGLAPAPGAWFEHDGRRIKVLAAAPTEGGGGAPGQVLDGALAIACGTGALRLGLLQREGRKAMAAPEFLRGTPIAAGSLLN